MFKVVADQLKISDGWVRCGHCADAFDATLNLQPGPGAGATPDRAARQVSHRAGDSGARPSVRLSVQKAPPSGSSVASGGGAPGHLGAVAVSTASVPPEPAPLKPPMKVPRPAPLTPQAPAVANAGVDSARTPLADAGDSGWLLPPSEAPDVWLSERSAPNGLAVGEPQAKAVARPRPASREMLEEPPLAVSARSESPGVSPHPVKRRAVVERNTDFAPLEGEWTHSAPDIDLTPSAFDSAFHEELERFAAAGAHAQRSLEEGAKPVSASPVQVDLRIDDGEPGAPPSFVLQARRQAFWRSAPVRALLVLLTVSLSALLLLQWALHGRDQLAARHPTLEPWLTRLCEPLDCRVAAPRQIDAVVIDSSQLVRRLGSFYAFDLVLKNTARIAVAMPALELTLTDHRDAVIVRRVFLPGELPGAPVALAAMGSLPLELRLSLADGDASSMTGYRALVFYP